MTWRDLFTDSQLAQLTSISPNMPGINHLTSEHMALLVQQGNDPSRRGTCCGAVFRLSDHSHNWCTLRVLHVGPHIAAHRESSAWASHIWRIWE
jgi:hypothetical protein